MKISSLFSKPFQAVRTLPNRFKHNAARFGAASSAGAFSEAPEFRPRIINDLQAQDQNGLDQLIQKRLKTTRKQTQALGKILFFPEGKLKTDDDSALGILSGIVKKFDKDGKTNILMQNIRKFYNENPDSKGVYDEMQERTLLMKAAHDVIYDVMRSRKLLKIKGEMDGISALKNPKDILNKLKNNKDSANFIGDLIALKFAGKNKKESQESIVKDLSEQKSLRAKEYRNLIKQIIQGKVPAPEAETFADKVSKGEYASKTDAFTDPDIDRMKAIMQ